MAWQQASQGSAVYAMPVDLGPLVQYYNSAQFRKYGITPPTTWAEFATAADKLHAANPSAAMANFDPENAQAVLALMQEDNAFPFSYTGGSTVGINFTGAAPEGVRHVLAEPAEQEGGHHRRGLLARAVGRLRQRHRRRTVQPCLGPVGMQLSIKKTIGSWRAAPMPQAKAGDNLSGNWGGSTVAVFAQSKHPAEAADVRRVVRRQRRRRGRSSAARSPVPSRRTCRC